ncbi:hypothetical protein ACSXAS_14675 [Clostridium perfringens]|uniref:hypothetical protein n=1 Tax=Clostridium perfringens TaxID=1502 RepID=UPI0022459D68|nr:hypothetical protein [Clostridium perfringens]MDU2661526.1 hypothetical protein [Clostridioides difficile]WEV16019.1 hypothetical protein PL325_15655 [Clostridium perfringens D]MCX0358908.1 hypothetical protein [Clostridium perfringens]MCX0400498.1 hypothetical protein [Clostridium perfringens]MCX0420109.1 hypothetical protein [Clostridium perfringens]
MKKIYLKKQLEELSDYHVEVIKSISETIEILNENYGENRDVDKDLGGYVLVVESLEDVKELKNGMLKDILPEYTDEIICSEGVNYTSSLFLLSSDFSVVVIAEEELSKILLE